MKFYLYDEKTKQFTKEQEGYLDPLETKIQGKNIYLVPPFSTTEKPNLSTLKDNEILVFNDNKWQVEQEFYVGKIVDCQSERVTKYVNDNDLTFEQCDNGFKIVEKPALKEPTEEEIKNSIISSVQSELDKTAQSKGYDNGFACASYSYSTDEIFRQEAQAYVEWRDKVWRYCYDLLDKYLAGEIEQPTVEYVLANMPKIEW